MEQVRNKRAFRSPRIQWALIWEDQAGSPPTAGWGSAADSGAQARVLCGFREGRYLL